MSKDITSTSEFAVNHFSECQQIQDWARNKRSDELERRGEDVSVNCSPKNEPISIMYWFVFLVSVISLSQFFSTDELYAAGENYKATLVLIVSSIVFASTVFYMTYKIYSEEKDKDNLRTTFAPYEKIYEFFEKRKKDLNNG